MTIYLLILVSCLSSSGKDFKLTCKTKTSGFYTEMSSCFEASKAQTGSACLTVRTTVKEKGE